MAPRISSWAAEAGWATLPPLGGAPNRADRGLQRAVLGPQPSALRQRSPLCVRLAVGIPQATRSPSAATAPQIPLKLFCKMHLPPPSLAQACMAILTASFRSDFRTTSRRSCPSSYRRWRPRSRAALDIAQHRLIAAVVRVRDGSSAPAAGILHALDHAAFVDSGRKERGQTRQTEIGNRTLTLAFMERLDLPAPNRTILHLRNGLWQRSARSTSAPP